jgi:DNA excision repair protein ERCC-2
MGGPVRVEVSVRELVELVWRSGDLRSEPGMRASPIEGIRGHRWIQSSRPESYRAELPLAGEIERGDLVVRVAGRADGVEPQRDPPLVEEIKTVNRPLILLAEDSHPLHWAQAELYAALYAEQTGAPGVDVQLTYLHLGSHQVRTFVRHRTAEQLARFADETFERLMSWIEPLIVWRERRNDSIREMGFPYDAYRSGQRELADGVAGALRRGRRLLAQAPTGTGKTMAVALGALEAMADGRASQLFFLTAKTTGRAAAQKAFDDLRRAGLRARALTLTARDTICPHPDRLCVAGDCPLAAGHYDRIDAAVRSLLELSAIDRAAVERVGAAEEVCPFLLSIASIPWCDAVICDMNYVFDPRVSPKVMESLTIGPRAYLVDEAHNLVDRAREMFSATIGVRELESGVRPARDLSTVLVNALESAISAIEVVGDPEAGEQVRWQRLEQIPPRLIDALEIAVDDIEIRMADAASRLDDRLAELYFRAHRFLRLARKQSPAHALFVEGRGRERRIQKFCVDPSDELRAVLGRRSAAVFFSATLSPPDYFARVLVGDEPCDRLRFDSPFPRENLRVVLADRVSTRYRDRAASLDAVVELIAAAYTGHPANQIAYLPSYEYLDQVLERFRELHPEIPHAAQDASMDDAERQAFLARFTDRSNGPTLGFAVLGGAFGEGIDLVGERLSGAIIIGVGLPAICAERELIRDHFARDLADRDAGFEFAYVYPGMNRVLQAAGRVIRSETDRGAIVLVGERFAEPRHRRLLPPEWGEIATVRDATELEERLRLFWERS